eukprot:2768522-Rhodomonas_salina.1
MIPVEVVFFPFPEHALAVATSRSLHWQGPASESGPHCRIILPVTVGVSSESVSYTHLTLPTICSV